MDKFGDNELKFFFENLANTNNYKKWAWEI